MSDNGNTTSNTIQFTNATTGFVTESNVGIANTNPQNDLDVGSNLSVLDTGSNVLSVTGNVSATSITIGDFQIVSAYGLDHVTNENNQTTDTIISTNATTGFNASSNIVAGGTVQANKIVSTSNLEVGTANLFVDTTTSNVGIGTNTPDYELDVVGNVNATYFIGDGSAISAIQSSNVSDFGSNVSRITNLESSRALKSDLNNNSSRITNLSSNLSDNSSRITALESGDISISGDKTFTGDIIFESNIHMNGGNVLVANTVNMTVSDPIIELGSNNIGANDLGIIMTRPAANSNVALVYDESADILRMGYTLNGANDSIVDLDSNALAVSVQGALSAASVSGDGSGLTSLNASNITTGALSTTTVTIDDYLIHDGDTDTKVGFPANDTFTVTTANSERLRVDSSGNVGIGTTSPAAVLDVFSSPHVTGYREMAHFRVSNTSDDSDFTRLIFGQVTTNKMFLETTNEANTKGDLLLQPYGGNVGIGTTNPGQKLSIYTGSTSTVGLSLDRFSSGNYRTDIYQNSHGPDFRVGYDSYTPESILYLKRLSDGSKEVEINGNVGIGTASPIGKLQVDIPNASAATATWDSTKVVFGDIANGNSQGLGFGVTTNSHASMISLAPGVAWRGLSYYSAWHKWYINNVEKMTLDASGNVGIGTASPGIVLDVGSSLSNPQIGRNYATGSVHDADKRDAIYFGRWDGTGRDFLGIKCRVDTHTALGYGNYSNQTKLEFHTWGNNYAASREVMCIRGDGNVGIGTASPTVSLYVQDGGNPSQSNSGLDGLFVANSGSSSSFFNIQSATGNGRVFAVTNTGVGKFDGGVSGSAADYAEMFEWIDGNPDDEDRRGLVVELVGGDKIQVATSTTSESNIIGVVSAEPCVLAGESTFHWTSKWLKDDFGSYQMEDYEAWQYSKGSGEPTVVPVEGTEPGDVPEDAVKVTAKRRIFNPDYDDTIEYVPRSQRKEWSPVGVVGRLRVKKGQPARSSWVKLKDVSEMIEEWFIR